MSNTALETETVHLLTDTFDCDRLHFKKVPVRDILPDLAVLPSYLRRFENPAADTAVPLEYAFYLLGDVYGKTVVDLSCGDGLNSVILATLGARVIAVDILEKNLKLTGDRALANAVDGKVHLVHGDAGTIPVGDGIVDRVLCTTTLKRDDCIRAARQIRRILKPGGSAVFIALTPEEACNMSRAVGRGNRRREFMLTSRLLESIGVRSSRAMKNAHQLDAWIMSRFTFTRRMATTLVWEGLKES